MTRVFATGALRRTALALIAAGLLAACNSKLTQENFARVEPGMTQQQVTAILGEPTESSSIGIGTLSGTSSTWTDGKTTISIQFVNDKVQAKQLSKPAGQPAVR